MHAQSIDPRLIEPHEGEKFAAGIKVKDQPVVSLGFSAPVNQFIRVGQVGHQLHGRDVLLARLKYSPRPPVRPWKGRHELNPFEDRVSAGLSFNPKLQLERRIRLGPHPRVQIK